MLSIATCFNTFCMSGRNSFAAGRRITFDLRVAIHSRLGANNLSAGRGPQHHCDGRYSSTVCGPQHHCDGRYSSTACGPQHHCDGRYSSTACGPQYHCGLHSTFASRATGAASPPPPHPVKCHPLPTPGQIYPITARKIQVPLRICLPGSVRSRAVH